MATTYAATRPGHACTLADRTLPDQVRQQDEFLDLICADADLLRTEFEAIVAASWSDASPPERGDGSSPAIQDHRFPWQVGGGLERLERLPTGPDHPGAGSRSRQRSPPSQRCP